MEWFGFHWLWWPAFFLWPVALLWQLAVRKQQVQTEQALYLQQDNLLRLSSVEQEPNKHSSLLWWIIWTLLVIAIARPAELSEPIMLPAEAREMVLAVDVSTSMDRADMRIGNKRYQRLAALQYVLGSFIEQREGDNIGLILFGSQAYVQAPITSDIKAIERFVFEAEVGIAGRATAIGDAIGLGLLQLRESDSEEKVMILATDGQNTAGEANPIEAAEAVANEIKIYTIGIGEADQKTLSAIANITGGQYFYARTADDLATIYQHIDQLEPVKNKGEKVQIYHEKYFVPLWLAAILIFGTSLLQQIKRVFT